jgi:thiol-disulfide isomerase/thioredoxin
MRLLLALGLAVGLFGLAGAQDKKDDAKPSLAEKIQAIQKELQEAQTPLIKEFQAAKTDKDKDAIREKAMAMMPKYAEKIVAAVNEHPKDQAALPALMQALQMSQGGPVGDKVADLIATNHADSPMLKQALPSLGSAGPAGEKLLKTLHEKAADKDTKGVTLYYLAAGKVEAADQPRTGQPLPADKQAAAFKEAEGILKQVAKDYGDVALPREGTIAKAVEKQLFFLNNLTVGKVLPDAEVQDLDGKKVKISDYRGKVAVLDIWATWCGPCVAMIPHSRELVKRMDEAKAPFALISLSADDKKETLTAFIEKTPMPWTQWWNGGAQGGAIEAYKVQFYPTIYVLDDKGVIRFKHVRGDAMDKAVEELLKEVKAKG